MIWHTLAQIPPAELWTFISGGLLLNVAPGQDVFFASACGIKGGPRAGALAGLGVGLGVVMHVTLVTAGLGAIVAAHPEALRWIKYIGAAYLLWLAVSAWTAQGAARHGRGAERPWVIIRRGFLSNALNPKPVLFLLAFLPLFTNPAWGPIWHQVLGLGLIFAFTGTLVTMGYGILAGMAGHAVGRHLGVLDKLASVLFVWLAWRLVRG